MAAYISEISYGGSESQDFVEIAAPAGTDLSAYSVYIYNSTGTVKEGPLSLGTVQTTVAGKDVYLVDSTVHNFHSFGATDAIALVDDHGNVLQFVSFAGNTVTATAGPATSQTSTDIGSSGMMMSSLQSDDGGSSYYSQSSSNPGTIPCYAPGTLIGTPDGPRPVEALRVGDIVATRDHGPRPIRWRRRADQPLEDAAPDARPVLIRAGAFGPGCPGRDLVVSPQHRILVGGAGQLEGFFAGQCLAPAKALTGLPRVRAMMGRRRIAWHHFALDVHAVVMAEGCLSESLLLGPMVLNGLSALQRRALVAIFGAAAPGAALNGPPARDCLTVGRTRRSLAMHCTGAAAAAAA